MRVLRGLLPVVAVQLALLPSFCLAVEETSEERELSFLPSTDETEVHDVLLEISAATSQEDFESDVIHGNVRGGRELATCYSYDDCGSCSELSRCHWCDHDQRCHVKGSFSGCLEGSTCSRGDDDKKDACSQHSTCSDCGNSHSCHWCAHDDSCHSIGSIYGCVKGVDCYSNDRCRRKEPEPLAAEKQTFTNMGFFPLGVAAFISSLLLLCASSCLFCACRTRKTHGSGHYELQAEDAGYALLTCEEESATSSSTEPENEVPQDKQPAPVPNVEEALSPEETGARAEEDPEKNYQSMEVEEPQSRGQQEATPLLTGGAQDSSEEISQSPTKCARRLLHVCTGFYVLAVVFIGSLTFGAIRLYPKIPEYSVCNDSVGWSKLFEKMATGNLMVDFEVLMSIENANHLTVALDEGHGLFKYDGTVIGSYTIPPVKASAMAITDVMIIATLHPPSWEAIALAKEYYDGKLVLEVDADVVVRTPFFLNYSQAVSVKDQAVNINEESDRHLCSCQKWDGSNSTLFVQVKHFLDGL